MGKAPCELLSGGSDDETIHQQSRSTMYYCAWQSDGEFVIVTLMIFLVPFLVSPVFFVLSLINLVKKSLSHPNGIVMTWS